VSDFDTYVGFRCSKKVEKHWVGPSARWFSVGTVKSFADPYS